MQNDKMQTHLSVDQIRICSTRHPSKNTKTSYYFCRRQNWRSVLRQGPYECSRIDWKIRPLNKKTKRWRCHFLCKTKIRHFTAGCKRFARILHSRKAIFQCQIIDLWNRTFTSAYLLKEIRSLIRLFSLCLWRPCSRTKTGYNMWMLKQYYNRWHLEIDDDLNSI